MSKRDALVAGFLAAIFMVLLLPMAPLGVDPHHDGIMVKPAQDVLAGQVLFRDTFLQYGALTTYFQALTLAIHPSLLALRLATVAVYGATLFFLYAAWRLILPRSLAIIAGALLILFFPAYETDPWNHDHWILLPWSSVFAMLFQAIGLLALFRVIRSERAERWGVILGVATAAVFWFRQPVGIMMAGSVGGIWLALHWAGWMPAESTKRVIFIRILTGFLGLHVLLLGGIVASGALSAWWYQNFVWPVRLDGAVTWTETLLLAINPAAAIAMVALAGALALPGLLKARWPGLPPAVRGGWFVVLAALLLWQHDWFLGVIAMREGGWSVLIPVVVVAVAVGSVVWAIRQRGARQPIEYYVGAAWAGLGLGSLMQYYPMGDCWHIFYSLGPVFGLVVYAAWRWSGWRAPVVAALFVAVLLPAVYFRVRLISPAIHRPLVTLTQPALLRGMKVPPAQARYLDQITRTLALAELLRPNIPATLIGNDALYLGLMKNLENPVPYFVTWRGLADQETNRERWAYIHRVRPVLILEKPRWEAVDEFYGRAGYIPILYVREEFLEIAFPRELAEAVGLTQYGLFGYGRPRPKTSP